MIKNLVPTIFAALSLTVLAPVSQAGVIQSYTGPLPANFSGVLPNQATELQLTFTLPSPGNVTIQTTSYATGGFQTNLALFNAAGNFISAAIPGGSPDPGTSLIGDSVLTQQNLAAGMYTVALMDFLLGQSLSATKLSDGFTLNFGNGTTFVDAGGNTRTAAYAFTINGPAGPGTPGGEIPEPSTLWLGTAALLWLGIRSRKRSR